MMKTLLLLTTLGFALWLVSEVLELAQGAYSPAVFYLTAAYHVLAGIGFWGLHRFQSPGRNRLSLVGTALVSLTYFALAYFPIQVMQADLTPMQYLTAHPAYRIPGILSLVGFLVFGAAVLDARRFPAWTGLVILLATLVCAFAAANSYHTLVNLGNIVLAGTVIFMAVQALRATGAPDPGAQPT